MVNKSFTNTLFELTTFGGSQVVKSPIASSSMSLVNKVILVLVFCSSLPDGQWSNSEVERFA